MRESKRARTAPFPQRPRSMRRAATGRAGSAPIPPDATIGSTSAPVADAEEPLPPTVVSALAEPTNPGREPGANHLPADQSGEGHCLSSGANHGEEHGEDGSPMSLLSDDSLSLALSRLPTRFALTSLAFVCRRWRRLALRHCVRELRPSPLTLRATGCFASADALADLVRRFSDSLRAIELRPPETSARGCRRGGGGRGKGKAAAEGDGAKPITVGEILRRAPMLEEVTITSCFSGSEGDGNIIPTVADNSTLSVIISSAASTNTTASGPAAATGRGSNSGSSSGASARNSSAGSGSSRSSGRGNGGSGFRHEVLKLGVPMRPLEFVRGALPHLPRSLQTLNLHANHFLSAGACLPGSEGGEGGQGEDAWGERNAEAAGWRGEGSGSGSGSGEEEEEQGEAGEGASGDDSESRLPLPHHATPHDSFLYALTSSLPSLRSLDLDTPSSLSPSAVLHLPLSLPRLTALSLCSNAITWPTVFSLLSLAPSLRCLSLVSSALTSTAARPRRPPFPSFTAPGPSSLESFPFSPSALPMGATTSRIPTAAAPSSFPSALLSSLPLLASLRLYTSPHRSVQWDLPPAHSLLHALLALPPAAAAATRTSIPPTPPTDAATTTTTTAAAAKPSVAEISLPAASAAGTAAISSTALGAQLPVLAAAGTRPAATCGSMGGSGPMPRIGFGAGAAGVGAAATGRPWGVGSIGSVGASPLRSLHAQHTFSASWQTIGVCCHGLTELDLSFPPRPFAPSSWGGAAAEGLTGIEEIVLCGTLSMLPRLERLALPSANDQVLRHVARCCPRLSCLLAQPHILATSPDSHLPRCPPLPHVTDDGIRALAHGCTRLVHLSMAGCVRVGSAVRQLAYHCQQLRVLRLEGSGVDDKAVTGALFGGAWKWPAGNSTSAAAAGSGGRGTGGVVQLLLPKLMLLDLWGCAAVTSELLFAILHAAKELAATAAATRGDGGADKPVIEVEAGSTEMRRHAQKHAKHGGQNMQEEKGEEVVERRLNGQQLQLRRLMLSPVVLKGPKGNGKEGAKNKGKAIVDVEGVDVTAVLQGLKEELPSLLITSGRTAKELLPWDGFIHWRQPWDD
ncbi:hypothetical protein CLOM_g19875 [Closterium sp. NIES-68]|nr:hypothetical protein CLOM_g19875 [Closterium sp. NIES-68]GJP60925.1 hypothetical protein CLOP_g18142 [Closterium sp. NIES-67]